MTIHRQYQKILIECDSCDTVFEGKDCALWAEVWSAAKEDGWRSAKIAGVWLHGCSKCGLPT